MKCKSVFVLQNQSIVHSSSKLKFYQEETNKFDCYNIYKRKIKLISSLNFQSTKKKKKVIIDII